jgi:hypothetical protein
MSHYFLTQTAGCIVASAVDFIKSGRAIPGVRIEGRYDAVLAGQQPYDRAIATIPLSTPERSCIGSPERICINDSGKKAPELGAFS